MRAVCGEIHRKDTPLSGAILYAITANVRCVAAHHFPGQPSKQIAFSYYCHLLYKFRRLPGRRIGEIKLLCAL